MTSLASKSKSGASDLKAQSRSYVQDARDSEKVSAIFNF